MSELQSDSAFRSTDTAGPPDQPRGYLHQPTISGDQVCFVSEDDLWVVDAIGGSASRLTVSVADISIPAYSPDGRLIAFAAQESGDKEVYCVSASGGSLARLTYLGIETLAGWTPEGNVCATSAYSQPFISRSGRHGGDHTWAYSIPLDGAPPERLPYGPVSALGFGAGGAMVLGRNGGDPAWWKRYRGGTAGQVWARADDGASWRRLFADLAGNLVCPMLVNGRVYFLSDHGGIANLYSATLDGSDLVQHTSHDDFFARWASTDGQRIVYQQGADIWLFDPSTDQTSRIEVVQNGSRPQRARRFVDAEPNLSGLSVSPHGRSIVLTVRGKPFAMDLFEGAVRQLGKPQGVRYRLSRWCGENGDVVTLSDDRGEDRVELYPADGTDARVSTGRRSFKSGRSRGVARREQARAFQRSTGVWSWSTWLTDRCVRSTKARRVGSSTSLGPPTARTSRTPILKVTAPVRFESAPQAAARQSKSPRRSSSTSNRASIRAGSGWRSCRSAFLTPFATASFSRMASPRGFDPTS